MCAKSTHDKSMTKKGKIGQKKSTVFLPKTLRVLKLLKYDDQTQQNLAKYLGISRQGLKYHITKLVDNGLIYDKTKGSNKWKFYGLTASGQKVLVEYESNERVELKGIENARWKCQIRNERTLQKFLFHYGFKMNNGMKNWIQWNGEIEGFSINVNIAKKTHLVITHPPYYEKDLQTAYHKVNDHILNVVNNLEKKWNFNLTVPEAITTRQYTMSNKVADYLLDKSSGTQLKLKQGKISIDASKGGEPRIEFEELDEAQKFADIPESLARLERQIEIQNKNLEQHNQVFTKAIETLMNQGQTTNDILTNLLSMQNQGKIEQKPLNNNSLNMFG